MTEQKIQTKVSTISTEERERLSGLFFSKWGLIIRNLCGTACVFVMLYIAYMDTETTRISIEHNQGWPNVWHFFIYTIGPTLCALSFMNAGGIIKTILSVTTLRDKAQDVLSAKTGGIIPPAVHVPLPIPEPQQLTPPPQVDPQTTQDDGSGDANRQAK